MDQLANAAVYSPLGQAMSDGVESSPDSPGSLQQSAKRLNPYFVEHLMGWKLGWTSAIVRQGSNAEAMALYRSALQQHLSCLLGDPASLEAHK